MERFDALLPKFLLLPPKLPFEALPWIRHKKEFPSAVSAIENHQFCTIVLNGPPPTVVVVRRKHHQTAEKKNRMINARITLLEKSFRKCDFSLAHTGGRSTYNTHAPVSLTRSILLKHQARFQLCIIVCYSIKTKNELYKSTIRKCKQAHWIHVNKEKCQP